MMLKKSIFLFFILFLILLSIQILRILNPLKKEKQKTNLHHKIQIAIHTLVTTSYAESNADDDESDDGESKEILRIKQNQENCEKANSEFNDANKEFLSSCQDAKITAFGSSNCFKHLVKCEKCQHMDLESDSDTGSKEDILSQFNAECTEDSSEDLDSFFNPSDLIEAENSSTDTALSILSKQGQIKTQAERQTYITQLANRFSNCPAASAQGLENKKEEMNKMRKEIQDLESTLNKKMQELLEVKNELEKEKSRILSQIKEIETTLEDLIAEMSRENQSLRSEATQKISTLEAEILKSHQRDRELTLEESVAFEEYIQKVYELKSQCHNAAIQQSNQRRQALLNANVQSANITRSPQDLFNKAGFSSDQKNRNFVRQLTQHCESDENVKRSRIAARRALRIKQAKLANDRKVNEEQRTFLTRQITSLKEEMQKSELQMLQEKMRQTKRAQSKIEQHNMQLRQITENLNKTILLKTNDVSNTNKQLKVLQDEYQTIKLYITTVEKYNPNSTYAEENTLNAALSEMQSTKIKAYAGLGSCRCCSKNDVLDSGACRQFSEFIKGYFNLSGGTTTAQLCSNEFGISELDQLTTEEEEAGTQQDAAPE